MTEEGSLLPANNAANKPDTAETLFVAAAFEALTVGLVILCLGVGISAPFLLLRRQKPVV